MQYPTGSSLVQHVGFFSTEVFEVNIEATNTEAMWRKVNSVYLACISFNLLLHVSATLRIFLSRKFYMRTNINLYKGWMKNWILTGYINRYKVVYHLVDSNVDRAYHFKYQNKTMFIHVKLTSDTFIDLTYNNVIDLKLTTIFFLSN